METVDLIVIGGGPGGYPAAIRAAQRGARVALVEREALGGTCLNWGCIPTKSLIASATLLSAAKHAAGRGLRAEGSAADYAAMAAAKDQAVAKLRGGIAGLLKAHGVSWVEGTASFRTRTRVQVALKGGGQTLLEGGRVLIASGSVPAWPAFLPKADSVMDSRGFLERTALPGRMIVLGGGVIGCELACLAAQLGVAVTLVEILPDILAMLDADVRAEARRVMEGRLKIRILTGQPLEAIRAGKQGVSGQAGGERIEAEWLLAALGRRPAVEPLALEKAGLAPSAKGFIEVDAGCQTAVAGIFAVGDVNGGPQLAHAATAQGLLAAEQAAGRARLPRAAVVPSCIFTAPEIAVVGLTEEEAGRQSRPVKVGKFPFAALGRAVASGETAGFVKWIVDSATDRLLGAAAVGAHATELIATAVTAVQAELTAAEFAATIQAHPTLSEAWMEAAHAVHGLCIHAPPRRSR